MLYAPSSMSTKASWILGLVLGTRGVMGGYLNVNMEPAMQCGQSLVTWSGDEGPYHLLLTPTTHEEHGYNVWLPTIPNGTTSYNLAINQPQGLQFVLTMWGASGISYAGTTDILTVGAPISNVSCFLTDQEILGLYTFSFNISDTSNNLPPQCSNLTMSWPTSLESNVTGTITARSIGEAVDDVFEETQQEDVTTIHQLDSSSSDNRGNTTYPPSMFGVIPLGNSFSIPITYAMDSKYAKYLPNSSRSDNPTTWTTRGVTYLNWTVPLAKGTRFILVAGIGSDQQWASGGSSALMTVGQGSTGCAFVDADGGNDSAPSITATTGTYQPTSTDETANAGPPPHGSNTILRTALACVLSVLATLAIIGLIFFCRRVRRKRREAAQAGLNYPSGSLRKLNRAGADSYGSDSATPDTPLDLIASRNGSRIVAPILTHTNGRADSPIDMSPLGEYGARRGPASPLGQDSQLSPLPSPTSPLGHRPLLDDSGRQSSLDPLLISSSGYNTSLSSPLRDTYTSGTMSSHRPLMLHDRSMGLPYEDDAEVGAEDNLPDLKRETLAMGESTPTGTSISAGSRRPGPAQRRRRDREEGMDYVVHRDAGRVRNSTEEGRRVFELPPRYDELNWEEGEGERSATPDGGTR